MSGNSSKMIAFNYFGGKFTWLEDLYRHFPKDIICFVDVFCGSMSVSLNYKTKAIKHANDINSDITNFFRVLREQKEELIEKLELTPCSVEEYDSCFDPSPDPVEQARRFFVRIRLSYLSLGGQRKNKGMVLAKTAINAKGGEAVSRWNRGIEKLHEVATEIRKNYQITNWDYSEVIEKMDHPTTFFYCDPPYSRRSRKSYNDYKFEFSDDDHRKLAERLHSIKGMAMVSGYDCSLMNELYSGWRKVAFKPKLNNARVSESQEVIWMNYEPPMVAPLFNEQQSSIITL